MTDKLTPAQREAITKAWKANSPLAEAIGAILDAADNILEPEAVWVEPGTQVLVAETHGVNFIKRAIHSIPSGYIVVAWHRRSDGGYETCYNEKLDRIHTLDGKRVAGVRQGWTDDDMREIVRRWYDAKFGLIPGHNGKMLPSYESALEQVLAAMRKERL